jgi:CO dehydrogenase nickel-insertion accessory protein CooC1
MSTVNGIDVALLVVAISFAGLWWSQRRDRLALEAAVHGFWQIRRRMIRQIDHLSAEVADALGEAAEARMQALHADEVASRLAALLADQDHVSCPGDGEADPAADTAPSMEAVR